MRQHKKYSNEGTHSTTSVCDMRRFPATMSYVLHEKIKTFSSVMTRFSEAAETEKEKQSWPLYQWHSVPDEAVILGEPFACPESPGVNLEKEIPPGRKRPDRPYKKVNAEVCLCPNNRDNGERQCSHKELICETISLIQAIDNLRKGGGGLFDVYVEKFPQLKDYVEPISGTAIANDQVSQQNWATLLAAVDSVSREGWNFDFNEAAADNGDEH
ncbi:hypothetical protein BCR37DRAFT_53995 [Protomyces lactucae-debilis]|uniref:Uncharacterized protein n=1 Tax=Protomyces lactucae-debilis TaxID=2754530 RepID=A0A1Y2FBX0_PROLT|nr:uncharacterized protein BCR37DRAFT_53995 [Protomyces lactucae-debilis]ORY80826.1 hypothetical protein BCR37DRAFT_53995 [Protomyces lactucae-debilis]